MDRARERPDARTMTALQRLIVQQKDAQAVSYGEIAMRAGQGPDGKPRLSRSRIQQLARSPIKRSLDDDTVRGLASGLRVPVDTVKDAISESLNLLVIRDSSDPDLAIYIDELAALGQVDRQRYIRMARALLEEFKR